MTANLCQQCLVNPATLPSGIDGLFEERKEVCRPCQNKVDWYIEDFLEKRFGSRHLQRIVKRGNRLYLIEPRA